MTFRENTEAVIPVRIRLEYIADGVELRFGLTASVMVPGDG